MLSEREIEDLIKFIAVQHNEGTDKPRDSCPACMTMDKYLAHRTEILTLAWGYFKLQGSVERIVNPPLVVDLRPGGLNPWPRLHGETSEYIKPRQTARSEKWFRLASLILGIVLGLLSAHYLH